MTTSQHFKEARITRRQQRTAHQVAQEQCGPDASHGNRNDCVPYAEVKALFVPGRFNNPVQIPEAHKHHPQGEPDQSMNVLLNRTREQDREWNTEVEQHEKKCGSAPASANTTEVEHYFFREIACPDDQPLRVAHVSPEHHEGEKQFAIIVEHL